MGISPWPKSRSIPPIPDRYISENKTKKCYLWRVIAISVSLCYFSVICENFSMFVKRTTILKAHPKRIECSFFPGWPKMTILMNFWHSITCHPASKATHVAHVIHASKAPATHAYKRQYKLKQTTFLLVIWGKNRLVKKLSKEQLTASKPVHSTTTWGVHACSRGFQVR